MHPLYLKGLLSTLLYFLALGFFAVQLWLWALILKTPPAPTAENPPTWREWLLLGACLCGPIMMAGVCAGVAISL